MLRTSNCKHEMTRQSMPIPLKITTCFLGAGEIKLLKKMVVNGKGIEHKELEQQLHEYIIYNV